MSEVEIPNQEELEELKGKAFTRRVALVTAIYAVFLAITSLGGSNAMKEMLLAQQQSSDQWSFYQAKILYFTPGFSGFFGAFFRVYSPGSFYYFGLV